MPLHVWWREVRMRFVWPVLCLGALAGVIALWPTEMNQRRLSPVVGDSSEPLFFGQPLVPVSAKHSGKKVSSARDKLHRVHLNDLARNPSLLATNLTAGTTR